MKRLLLGVSFLAVAGAASLELAVGGLGANGVKGANVIQQAVSVSTTQTTSGSAAQSSASSAPAGYVFLAPLSAVQGKSYAYFTHPTYGDSILIDVGGQWRAFSAVCTHAGCTVELSGQSLYCPCHAGYFSATDGSVQGGPPPSPLAEYGVELSGGNLYVSLSRTN